MKEEPGVRIRFHDLRHSAATRMARAGVPLFHIQKALGQNSSRMTQRYSHLQDDDMAAAMETLEQV